MAAGALRGALRCAEPFYAGAMTLRNAFYERGIFRSHDLGRPTISVGNLTTGGTGKTPVVRWLADALRQAGHHPAILLRGYREQAGMGSDEAMMLDAQLNAHDGAGPVPIETNPSRIAAAAAVIDAHPGIDVILLDDAFQHRRAKRDFDLVLIDASNPFGFGHVHPRGLLREPVRGVNRASAVLLTRCDATPAQAIARLRILLARYVDPALIYQSSHAHAALRTGDGEDDLLPIETLRTHRFFAFSGIGRPDLLHDQLSAWGASYVGHQWFDDHHAFTGDDLKSVSRAARDAGAAAVVTTHKDWTKVSRLLVSIPSAEQLPIWRLDLKLQFADGDEARLLAQLQRAVFGTQQARA